MINRLKSWTWTKIKFLKKEKHIFEIKNNSAVTTSKFELNNQNFILNTPYNIQIKSGSSKKIEIENLVPYSNTNLKVIIDKIQKEYSLKSSNSSIIINRDYLNFEKQIINTNKDLSFEIQNLNKENIAIELKLSNQQFIINGRKNFAIMETKKKLKLILVAICLGRKNADLNVFKGNQIIKTISLDSNCTPDFKNITFIKSSKKLDLGFVSNQVKRFKIIHL